MSMGNHERYSCSQEGASSLKGPQLTGITKIQGRFPKPQIKKPKQQQQNSPPVFVETRRAGRDPAQEGTLSRHFQKPLAMESGSERPVA